MNVERFKGLLKGAMGLEASSIGLSAIDRAVQARVAASGLCDADAYWTLVSGSPVELQALIEQVVVPETWFFRDAQAFAALARLALEAWASRGGERPLRLLSLPCATGEEAYTISMALLDAGVPASAFRIDAVDISAVALAQARRGVYGRNSFRGADLAFRGRHFEATTAGHRISDDVRAPVQFVQGNLFDPKLGLRAESYDFVLCRNLLIYFDPADQQRAIGILRGLLTANGVLFIGHAEAGLMHGNGFMSARIPQAFAFRRAVAASPSVQRPAAASVPPQPRPKLPVPPAPARRLAAPPPPRPVLVHENPPSLDRVRQLADSGRLDEAVRLGSDYLRHVEPTPEALYLLGVISDAAGDRTAAAHFYRKTLYLDPGHQEALDHLALLLEKQGDQPAAKVIRDRARRLEQRGGR